MQGVQNFTIVSRDMLHTVLAVSNTQVLQNVLDIFKQQSGNSFPQYKKLNYSANEVNVSNFTKYVNTIMSENCMNKTVQV